MVQARRFVNPEDAAALGRLDSAAIETVRSEAWPEIRDADELHDALLLLGCMTDDELNRLPRGEQFARALSSTGRLIRVQPLPGKSLWFATERLHIASACYGETSTFDPAVEPL